MWSPSQAQSWARFCRLYCFITPQMQLPVVYRCSAFFRYTLNTGISQTPLDRSVILLEEVLQIMRKLVSFGRNVQMSIDGFPAQVLQSGHAAGERSDELQRDLLPTAVNVVDIPTLNVPFILSHVEMNQLENAVKVGNRLNVLRVSLQVKRV